MLLSPPEELGVHRSVIVTGSFGGTLVSTSVAVPTVIDVPFCISSLQGTSVVRTSVTSVGSRHDAMASPATAQSVPARSSPLRTPIAAVYLVRASVPSP